MDVGRDTDGEREKEKERESFRARERKTLFIPGSSRRPEEVKDLGESSTPAAPEIYIPGERDLGVARYDADRNSHFLTLPFLTRSTPRTRSR